MSDDRKWNPDRVRINVARDLRAIVEMYEQLPEHAQAVGDPDGEAVLMLGPVANPEAFNYRMDASADTSHAADQFEADLLFMLATWEGEIRDERDQPTDLRATVQRAADYLLGSLDWCLSDDEYGNLRFLGIDKMADDIKGARARLENLLHAGDRSDRGAPCLVCGTALVKDWAGTKDAPEPPENDRWRCPNRECDVTYVDGDELNLAIKNTARQYAEWLTATDMAAEYRIPVGTLQSWASRRKVRKRRDFDSGRMVYNVADTLAQRDKADEERMGA